MGIDFEIGHIAFEERVDITVVVATSFDKSSAGICPIRDKKGDK